MTSAYSFPIAAMPEHHEALRQNVRDFLETQRSAKAFVPTTSGWVGYDRAFSQACGAAGFIGMTWPEVYGGRARPAIERYIVMEELLAAGAPVGAHWITDRQSGPQIIRYGVPSLRDRLLPKMARGEVFFAIGMSEPNAGSDLASVVSRGRKVDGGWRLDGRKIWTTNGHRADYMIGLFRTEPRDASRPGGRHEGLSQFVIDLTLPGVSRSPIMDICGEADFSEITFDDVFIPDEHLLGEAGRGWDLVTSELAFERSGPERFLSAFPLVAEAVAQARLAEGAASDLGRAVIHMAILRQMSMSIASRLGGTANLGLEAALVKDAGNAHEQTIPELLRKHGVRPEYGGDGLSGLLAYTLTAAPSFTLRGGTPEVLKGIIARGLGLR